MESDQHRESQTAYDLARRGGVAAPLILREPVHVRGRREPIRVYGLAAGPAESTAVTR